MKVKTLKDNIIIDNKQNNITITYVSFLVTRGHLICIRRKTSLRVIQFSTLNRKTCRFVKNTNQGQWGDKYHYI